MSFFREEAEAPTAKADLPTHVKQQEQSSKPDHAQPQRHPQYIALLRCWPFICQFSDLVAKEHAETNQSKQTQGPPDDMRAVPAPVKCHLSRGHEGTMPCTHSVKSM